MAHSPDDRRALFQRVVDDIRDQIRSGRLQAEAQVPSANQIAETYGIAQMTAQRALRELQNQGLIYAIQGRGTYVHPTAVARLRNAEQQPAVVPITDQATHDREQARLDTTLATRTQALPKHAPAATCTPSNAPARTTPTPSPTTSTNSPNSPPTDRPHGHRPADARPPEPPDRPHHDRKLAQTCYTKDLSRRPG